MWLVSSGCGYDLVCVIVGGRKDKEGEQERQRAQRIVAKERALMNMKRLVYHMIQLC